MKLLLSLTVAMLLLVNPIAARTTGDAIKGVISDQIAAFERNDLEEAFSHASPNIRLLFITPERFGQMVQQGYPMVWRPASLRFASRRTLNGRDYQIVVLQDQAGRFHALEYEMVPDAGGWKINGVRIVEMPDTGT